MRPLVNTLSVIGLAAAIADKAAETTDDQDSKAAYAAMEAKAMETLHAFPGSLTDREIKLTHRNISMFCDAMDWDRKQKHIQTLINFSSQQLEHIRNNLVAHNADRTRIEAIENLIGIEADIYDRYAKKEYPLCAVAGQRASDVWSEIWNLSER